MVRRLFVAILALTVLALGGLAVLLVGVARDRLLHAVEGQLRSDIVLLRYAVQAEPRPEALGPALRRSAEALGARFTIIGPDGRVLADSHANPSSTGDHNARPEIKAARTAGRGLEIRHSDTVGERLMYLAEPLDPSRPEGAVVRAAISVAEVDAQLGSLRVGALAGVTVVGLAVAGLGIMAARRLAAPLRDVQDVAEAMASGDLERRAPLSGRDEAAAVGRALNRLAQELSSQLERLRAERARLEATFASLDDGVLTLDGEGRILHLNAAASTLFGFASAAPSGVRLWEVVRFPGLEEGIRRALQERRPFQSTVDMGPRTLSLRLGPVREGSGAVLVARDVTEDRRYDELRREFVANASHELRTPLTMIQGYVETLVDGAWRDPARAPEFLEVIDKNVRRLADIVRDLLDLSRLESGGEVVAARPVDAGALLERVRDAYAPMAGARRQTLAVDPPAAVSFQADPILLERALANLVDNAIKYTPEGGSVRLGAERRGDRMLLRVTDTGIGVPPEDLGRIFERFYRVDKSRSREMGGTGLGLSIVKHIAQLHGGDVAVESSPGRGSVFTITLPA